MRIRKYNEAWRYGDDSDQRAWDKEAAERLEEIRKHKREEFYDYVKSCFANLTDKRVEMAGHGEDPWEISDRDNYLAIYLDLPSLSDIVEQDTNDTKLILNSLIKYNNYINEIYEEALACLKLVEQKYPTCKHDIQPGDTEIDKNNTKFSFPYLFHINIFFSLE